MAEAVDHGMVDPAIFKHLQAKIDENSAVREELKEVITDLEKQDRATQAILSRAHSTAGSQISALLQLAEASLKDEVAFIQRLAGIASKHPYYQYNWIWTRHMQDSCFSVLFTGWLGGFSAPPTTLLTIEKVGTIMGIPVNISADKDEFHLTIEEYLHAVISLVEELARLARNSVTLGDYARPLHISRFVKDLHAGFSILNLKNDALRRRTDGIKYKVKEVEDVVYDLSLRNLLPAETASQ